MGIFNFKKRNKTEVRTLPDVQQTTNEPSVGAVLSNKIFKNITHSGGINLAPVFNAINLISNSCAIIPWKALNENNEWLKSTHYLNHLFDNAPINRFNAIKGVIVDVLIKGNGFLYIDRNYETGKPERLIYLPANTVSILKGSDQMTLFYMSSLIKNTRYISANDMLHFKVVSSDGLIGEGIPIFAHNTFETAEYTEQAVSDYMAAGGQVSGILTPNNSTTPGVPTLKKQVEEIRRQWDDARSRKNSSTVILPADLKFTQLSANAKDSALIDTRLYNLQEIARFFNISPILLGDLSHNYYNSVSEAQTEFIYHTLQPYLVMIEEEINKKLVMPSKKGLEHIDLDEKAIVSIDKEKQSKNAIELFKSGIISLNEARESLGYSEVENGTDLYIPYTNVNENYIGNTEGKQKENNNEQEKEQEDETTSTTTQIDENKEDEE